jgi:hypothetical protein
VADVDFFDENEGKSWFEKQTPKTRSIITSRFALRVLANVVGAGPDNVEFVSKAVFRATLLACIAGLGKIATNDWLAASAVSAATSAEFYGYAARDRADALEDLAEIETALEDVDDIQARTNEWKFQAADYRAGIAALCAAAAAKAFDSSADAIAPFFALPNFARRFDEHLLLEESFSKPLWLNADVPSDSLERHQSFLSYLAADQNWRFFHDWYLGMWNGTFTDWELAIEVAKIPDEIWDGTLEELGREIERRSLQLKTNVGPQLVRTQNNLWDVEPDVTIDKEPLDFAIGQVEVSLAAALAAGSGNGLTESSPETIAIRSACEKYRDQGSIVAATFWGACATLDQNIGDLYPEDASLLVLKNTLYTSVEELCRQDDLIRDRIGRLAALSIKKEPTPQEREELQQVPEVVEDQLTDQAAEALQETIDVVVKSEKPPRFSRARLVNWITTIASGIDKAQKNEKRFVWLLKLAGRLVGWVFDDEEDNPED